MARSTTDLRSERFRWFKGSHEMALHRNTQKRRNLASHTISIGTINAEDWMKVRKISSRSRDAVTPSSGVSLVASSAILESKVTAGAEHGSFKVSRWLTTSEPTGACPGEMEHTRKEGHREGKQVQIMQLLSLPREALKHYLRLFKIKLFHCPITACGDTCGSDTSNALEIDLWLITSVNICVTTMWLDRKWPFQDGGLQMLTS